MRSFKLKGLVAAPYTPFSSNGDLNLPVIEKQADFLVANGVSGAFICGTTGEGTALTFDERKQVAARWCEVAQGRLNVIVHVGNNSQREAIQLAAHAQSVGASAIAALAPFFFKPVNTVQLIDFIVPVAAAARQLPFYYYNLPSMTGVSMPMVDLLTLGRERIPTLNGIKFTHGDLMEYQRCHNLADGAFDVAWGVDEMLLGALAIGATSAVGSTYNYAAPLYLRMIKAFHAGDLDHARDCANKSVEMIALLLKHGVLRVGKATMAMVGIDCGPTRSPVKPLDADEIRVVRNAYEKLGFFEWSQPSYKAASNGAVVPAV